MSTATAAGQPFLRAYQVRVLQSLRRGMAAAPGAAFTVLFPRQAGKNELAAELVAGLLRTHAARGGTVVVCAPTATPQVGISAARLRAALARTDRLFPEAGRHRLAGDTIAVGAATAVFLSASPEAHVAGHTASLALIADEAQDIDAAWFDRQFRPMAAAYGAPTVLFGTPWDGRSLLDRAVAANRAHDARQPGQPYRDFDPRHHETTWEEVAASNPHYGAYVRAERDRLGATHPLFLSQYGLRTVESAGRLLNATRLARLEGAHARLRAPLPGERYVAGLDVGGDGAGADATVLTVARSAGEACEVVEHLAWRGQPFAAVERQLREALRRWRPARLLGDATGLGAPLMARLEQEPGLALERFVFGEASKSALGFALVAAAETGRLRLYADDGSAEARACREELAACTADAAPGGRLRWGAARGHDDFVTSLALCLRAHEGAGPPRVARGTRRERP